MTEHMLNCCALQNTLAILFARGTTCCSSNHMAYIYLPLRLVWPDCFFLLLFLMVEKRIWNSLQVLLVFMLLISWGVLTREMWSFSVVAMCCLCSVIGIRELTHVGAKTPVATVNCSRPFFQQHRKKWSDNVRLPSTAGIAHKECLLLRYT